MSLDQISFSILDSKWVTLKFFHSRIFGVLELGNEWVPFRPQLSLMNVVTTRTKVAACKTSLDMLSPSGGIEWAGSSGAASHLHLPHVSWNVHKWAGFPRVSQRLGTELTGQSIALLPVELGRVVENVLCCLNCKLTSWRSNQTYRCRG